jgi:hypothetical protein
MVIWALEIVINFYSVKFLSACRSVKKANQIESNFLCSIIICCGIIRILINKRGIILNAIVWS